MAQSEAFRTALFGGYNKEDVDKYIKNLEHEMESIKVLHQKEKQELMRRAEDSETELALVRADLESMRGQIKKEEGVDEGELETLRMLEAELEKAEAARKAQPEPMQILEEEAAKARDAQEEVEKTGPRALEEAERARILEEAKESGRAELARLQTDYARLEEENRSLKKKLEKKDDLFDYDTVIKIMEEARINAELIKKEAKQKADQMIEEAKNRALAEEERQRHMIASRVNAQLEEKGIQLMAAKYKIEQYMKEIEGAQQGLYHLNTRMEKMVKDMPVRLDDYWEEEKFRQLEKKDRKDSSGENSEQKTQSGL